MDTLLLVSSVFLWIVVLLNLVLTLALVRRVNATSNRAPDLQAGPPSGAKAPDFNANTVNGEAVMLPAYAGHPTTFVFISPNCEPCRELLPALNVLAPQAREAGTALVLVSDGTREETIALVQEMELHLPVLIAPRTENTFFADYQITMTPSYCSLDKQGVVLSAGYPGPPSKPWQTLTASWSQRSAVL